MKKHSLTSFFCCLLGGTFFLGLSSVKAEELPKNPFIFDQSIKVTHPGQVNPTLSTDVHDFYVTSKWAAEGNPINFQVDKSNPDAIVAGGGIEKLTIKTDSLILDSLYLYVANITNEWNETQAFNFEELYVSIYDGLPSVEGSKLVYGSATNLNATTTFAVENMDIRYIRHPQDESDINFYPITPMEAPITNDIYRVSVKFSDLKLPRGEYYIVVVAKTSADIKWLLYTPDEATQGNARTISYQTGEFAYTNTDILWASYEKYQASLAMKIKGTSVGSDVLTTDASLKASVEQSCDMSNGKVWVSIKSEGKNEITSSSNLKIEYAIDTFDIIEYKYINGEFVEGGITLPEYKVLNCSGGALGNAIIGSDSTVSNTKVCGSRVAEYLLYPKNGTPGDPIPFVNKAKLKQRIRIKISMDNDQWPSNNTQSIEFAQLGVDLRTPLEGVEIITYTWSPNAEPSLSASSTVEPAYTEENGGWQLNDTINVIEWLAPAVLTNAVTYRPGKNFDQTLYFECLTTKENQYFFISPNATTFGKRIKMELGYINAAMENDSRVILDTIELYSRNNVYNGDEGYADPVTVQLPGEQIKLYLKAIEQEEIGKFVLAGLKITEVDLHNVRLQMADIPLSECSLKDGIFNFYMENKGSIMFNDSINISFNYKIGDSEDLIPYSYSTKADLGNATTVGYREVKAPFTFEEEGVYSIYDPAMKYKIDGEWIEGSVLWDPLNDILQNLINTSGPVKNRYSTDFETREERNSWVCLNTGAEASGIGQWTEWPIEAVYYKAGLELPDEGYNSTFAIKAEAGNSGATWVHSPCIELSADSLYKISYYTKWTEGGRISSSSSLNFSYMLTNQTRNDLPKNIFHRESILDQEEYIAKTTYMAVPQDETYYVGIMFQGGMAGTSGYLDDFELKPIPVKPVTGLSTTKVETSSISIVWVAPTGVELNPEKYIIRVNDKNVDTVNADVLTYKIEDLDDNTEYTISVVAAYMYMVKASATSVKATTLEKPEIPSPEAPLNLKISSIDSTSAVITWEAPELTPDSYVVYLDTKAKDTVTATTYTFKNLSPKTEYIAGVSSILGDLSSNIITIEFKTKEITSIEIDGSIKANIYPNPSKYGRFNLESSFDGEATVFDQSGRKIKVTTIRTGKNVIDLSTQKDGIYFLQLSTPAGVKTIKLVK